ncbi:abhydrolase domain-containing protein [Eremomyces bilateralis CBS 781.70]|uniref:Abhydrolase domain-containing protein n=1 Tax=Eremomyces bilateralis CBS 781.70 TaxID=1392243 RepID=A0A6G1G5W7_9PEZI|nr:abhydrolase domain-containing protein [Eremomyces bilateralis CBS 781.70]KAF1813495.1 abhydrolase domain-containing protein [Eremomyces bilateralis CBS 781.70]
MLLIQRTPPGIFHHPATRLISRRAFTSSRVVRRLALSYDLHEPSPKQDGEQLGAPIVFLHGLFGSKQNNRSMSKALARDLRRPVYAVDLRNHGDSPHDPTHDYLHLANDVETFLEYHKLTEPTLIGHSMGAKVAMTVALRSPPKVANLIAVDNAPVDAALKSDFGGYIRGMRQIEEKGAKRQSDADEILKSYAPELPIRQFLLTNLTRPQGSEYLKFRIPVKYLADALDKMADFPFKDPEQVRFAKPALFVRGTKSHYMADETLPVIGRFFPLFQVVDVEGGHWVISENPEAFKTAVVEFLQQE